MCRIRNAGRVVRIVACCFCLLTFARLASALLAIAASSSPQAAPYRFTHYLCEEVGVNAVSVSPTVLQFGRVGVGSSARSGLLRAPVESLTFVRSQPLMRTHRRNLLLRPTTITDSRQSTHGTGQYCWSANSWLDRSTPIRQASAGCCHNLPAMSGTRMILLTSDQISARFRGLARSEFGRLNRRRNLKGAVDAVVQ
jgi:hypothetical protein